jgi:trans-aconitate methyltransferase
MALHLITTPIKDVNVYNYSMEKTLADKCFFLDVISKNDYDTIIDFGCADGATIEYLIKKDPNKKYIGYDISVEQLKLAEKRFSNINGNRVIFTNDFLYCLKNKNNAVLLLNSVIHEIYSYCDRNEIELFWSRIKQFKYVSIRDMCFDNHEVNSVLSLKEIVDFYHAVPEEYRDRFNDFQAYWKDVTTPHQLIHFLLKVHYKENWERELRENYFPVFASKIIYRFSGIFQPIFWTTFTLDYLEEYAQKEFNTSIKKWHTHIKAVYKKYEKI